MNRQKWQVKLFKRFWKNAKVFEILKEIETLNKIFRNKRLKVMILLLVTAVTKHKQMPIKIPMPAYLMFCLTILCCSMFFSVKVISIDVKIQYQTSNVADDFVKM